MIELGLGDVFVAVKVDETSRNILFCEVRSIRGNVIAAEVINGGWEVKFCRDTGILHESMHKMVPHYAGMSIYFSDQERLRSFQTNYDWQYDYHEVVSYIMDRLEGRELQ